MKKSIFAIATMISAAHCSVLSDSEDVSERSYSPAPRRAIFYNCNDIDSLANYPTNMFNHRSFLPLEISSTGLNTLPSDQTYWDKLHIENSVRGMLKKLNIDDKGIVSKTLATFFLAFLFLLIYNGFFLHFY